MPASAPATALPASALGEFWHSAITQLIAQDSITKLVRELALQSELLQRDGDTWHITTDRHTLHQPKNIEQLRQALQPWGCENLVLDKQAAHDTPALRNKALAEQRQRRAEAIVMQDPNVQHLMHSYGATIVPGSIRPL